MFQYWYSLGFAAAALCRASYVGYPTLIQLKMLSQLEDGIYVWREWYRGDASSLEVPSASGDL